MDVDVVKAFNSEVSSLCEVKPPISKAKIVEITKAALKAIRYYKHVVFIVEKFLQKCKPEYKISGLYIIDSIVRQSQHQYSSRDVFGPRFAQNMKATLQALLCCSTSDKLKIVRVLNLWKTGKVFEEALVMELLNHCNDSGLETDVKAVEMKVKGDKANMDIYVASRKRRKQEDAAQESPPNSAPEVAVPEPAEPSDVVPENGLSEREFLDLIRSVNLDLGGAFSADLQLLRSAHRLVNDKLVKQRELDTNSHGSIQKLLTREFDYSDEDSGDEGAPRPAPKEPAPITRDEVVRVAGRILDQEEIKSAVKQMAERRFQEVNGQFVSPAPVPPVAQFAAPPSAAPVHEMVAAPMPLEMNMGFPPMGPPPSHTAMPGPSAFSMPPPPFGLFGRSDRDDRIKRPRSRSPLDGGCTSQVEVDKEKEKERRKLCLPPRTKPGHMLIGSCTIWLGKLPANTGENDIRAALSEIGEPLRIDILPMRACAYVTMKDRKTAAKIVDRLKNSLQISKKYVKLDWAPGQMVKDRFKHHWDGEFGVTQIPYEEIPVDIEFLLDGVYVDSDSLPEHLKAAFSNKREKHPNGEAVMVVPPCVAPSILVPQLPSAFPPAQFPFGLPPNPQALQFLPPTFPLPPLVQGGPEGNPQMAAATTGNPQMAAATTAAMLPSGGPPMGGPHPGNGNFRPQTSFDPRDGRGMPPHRGGYRHQFFGNQRGGRSFNHVSPPRFPPHQDFHRQAPPVLSPPAEAPPQGERRSRRSKLFQSEQPRHMDQPSAAPPMAFPNDSGIPPNL
uniref:CID domain-containing protein n=1 Tax=Steinernema glaseri TaxID=37863 RepID=A0A1I8A6E8_9BILA